MKDIANEAPAFEGFVNGPDWNATPPRAVLTVPDTEVPNFYFGQPIPNSDVYDRLRAALDFAWQSSTNPFQHERVEIPEPQDMPHYREASHYMGDLVFDRKDLINRVVSELKHVLEYQIEFDTLIGTGLSAALILPEVAERLGVYWAIVRKPNDSSHADVSIEGQVGSGWLFFDDLISSGATLRRVVEKVNEFVYSTVFRGAYLHYRGRGFEDALSLEWAL